MPYRAFVAATKQDLDKQREHVTDRLRLAGLVVDPLENWLADAEHPAKLSAKRTAGCHFCIALVAYQRGTIASHDPHARSTALEIREAARKGACVWCFFCGILLKTERSGPNRLTIWTMRPLCSGVRNFRTK